MCVFHLGVYTCTLVRVHVCVFTYVEETVTVVSACRTEGICWDRLGSGVRSWDDIPSMTPSLAAMSWGTGME